MCKTLIALLPILLSGCLTTNTRAPGPEVLFTAQAWLELDTETDTWKCLELGADGQARTWWGQVDRSAPRGPWALSGARELGAWELLESAPGWASYTLDGVPAFDVLDMSSGDVWTQQSSLIWDGGSIEHRLYQPSSTFSDGVCAW